MKRILTVLLVGIAVAGGIVAARKTIQAGAPGKAVSASPESTPQIPEDGIVVTYFTTDVRCPSCRKIEQLTRKTVESQFSDAVSDGLIVFRVVNTDREENAHFLDEYNLVSKTVIISQREGGEETGWQNLQDVWLKLDDDVEFSNYLVAGIMTAGPSPNP